jgi:hypothetical protein
MQETDQIRQALERPGEDVLDGVDCPLLRRTAPARMLITMHS